jgi:D-cysteine desulfhydrase family pyridoxal phosphate-dependent enzyme
MTTSPTAARSLETVPRCSLAPLPTPLVAAQKLGHAVGVPKLWFKRDDLIAFGGGGNKIRGLEFLLADALAQDADIILTGAGAQSNHVRATAAAAAFAGLDALAIYWGAEPDGAAGNFALTRLLGAQTRFTRSSDRASVDRALAQTARDLRAAGRRPYVIPRGGACALGVAGHILAVAELAAQCARQHVEPDAIVMAVGSGGTFAGWLAGIRLHGLPWRLAGFTVSRPAADVRDRIVELAAAGAAAAGIDVFIERDEVIVHDGFLGAGYGVPSLAGDAATALAARRDGILLDPTYTGKAFAGLIAHAAAGSISATETVIFLHTGGQPTLYARAAGEA